MDRLESYITVLRARCEALPDKREGRNVQYRMKDIGLAAFSVFFMQRRVLIALDGSEHFCSRKIHCPHCSTRKRSDGETEYFHSFAGATLVAPGHTTVCRCRLNSFVRRMGPRSRIASRMRHAAGCSAWGRNALG